MMKNESFQMRLPDFDRCIGMTMKNLALQAIPDGSITLFEGRGGWMVGLGKANLSAVLTTDRGEVKQYASLDTAAKQLKAAGINGFFVKPRNDA
jgi:hypothetical protein